MVMMPSSADCMMALLRASLSPKASQACLRLVISYWQFRQDGKYFRKHRRWKCAILNPPD